MLTAPSSDKPENSTVGQKGKFARYLLYAIGEIILVVIGILIAIQLNTWKDTNAERTVEKGYIFSLIEDIKKDNQNFELAIELNEVRLKRLDTLANLCFNYDKTNDAQIYTMFMYSLKHPDFVSQTDRTIAQLRNAGGMRLITKQTTADSIVLYEAYFYKLMNQQRWYEDMLKNLADVGVSLVNFKHFITLNKPIPINRMEEFKKDAKLITEDEKLIIEFGNKASLYKGVTNFYLHLLKEGKEKSNNLIKTLQTDYSIK